MGKDRKLTRATELGYICSWRPTPWALPPSTKGSLQNAHNCSPVMTAGTRCQRDPARAVLQHQLCEAQFTPTGSCFHSKRLPELWALYQVCVVEKAASVAVVLLLPYPVLGLRIKPSAPIQSPVSPEPQKHRSPVKQLQCLLDGNQLSCCHSPSVK